MYSEPILSSWQWPEHLQHGSDPLAKIVQISDLYGSETPPVCYPGTNLDPEAIALAIEVLRKNPNMIGTHTHGKFEKGAWVRKMGEGGFETVQELEASVIWMIASMIGGSPETVDGLFCGGGTESNLQGMWIGRNWLQKHSTSKPNEGIVILTTPLIHYSVIKNAEMLGIGEGKFVQCPTCKKPHRFKPDASGTGVTFVGMNSALEMDMNDLRRVFHEKYARGFRRFMVIPTVGTTDAGSIDPVAEISSFIDEMEKTSRAKFYMHVDASFGGFTVPFVNQELKIGFENPRVMSITLDGDKMGRLPYPAGVFLCRKGLTKYIARRVAYVQGNHDDSVSGSRSALPAVLAWYQYQKGGTEGQRMYVQTCIDARDNLARRFQKELSDCVTLMPYSPWVNLLPIKFSATEAQLKKHVQGNGPLVPYQLRSDRIPHNPLDIHSCPDVVYKLCIMPHLLRPGILDTFLLSLATALHR